MSNRQEYFRGEPPEDIIPPMNWRIRPEPSETPKSRAADIEMGLRIESVFLSHQLGLEIQAA